MTSNNKMYKLRQNNEHPKKGPKIIFERKKAVVEWFPENEPHKAE